MTTGGRLVITRRDRRTVASRRRILDAAVECLVEVGYARASTVLVQRRAGVSRGGLLHHFPSKNALLAAAAGHLAVQRIAEFAPSTAAFVSPDGSPERIEEAVTAMWQRYQEPYFRAAIELWVAAVHDPELLAALHPAEQRLNATIRDLVAVMFGPALAGRPGFAQLRDVLLTSMRGVALADPFDGTTARHERHLAGWVAIARATLLSG